MLALRQRRAACATGGCRVTPPTPTQAARRGRSTRLRGAHTTALLWAAWLLLVIAFVTWRALT